MSAVFLNKSDISEKAVISSEGPSVELLGLINFSRECYQERKTSFFIHQSRVVSGEFHEFSALVIKTQLILMELDKLYCMCSIDRIFAILTLPTLWQSYIKKRKSRMATRFKSNQVPSEVAFNQVKIFSTIFCHIKSDLLESEFADV